MCVCVCVCVCVCPNTDISDVLEWREFQQLRGISCDYVEEHVFFTNHSFTNPLNEAFDCLNGITGRVMK